MRVLWPFRKPDIREQNVEADYAVNSGALTIGKQHLTVEGIHNGRLNLQLSFKRKHEGDDDADIQLEDDSPWSEDAPQEGVQGSEAYEASVTDDVPQPSSSPRSPTEAEAKPPLQQNTYSRAAEAPRSESICMLVVGTRGDVQPFLAIAHRLYARGHRVRLATHEVYRSFVASVPNIEFYPLGGDPTVLSEFVVRNRGVFLTPSVNVSSKFEDIKTQERQLQDIVMSSYKACTEADPEDPEGTAFHATAIIANPPSIAYIVCAEKLQVPCHVMFTMPWSPTKDFPHPMANVSLVNIVDAIGQKVRAASPGDLVSLQGTVNRATYLALDQYIWLGVARFIAALRRDLDLKPYPLRSLPAEAMTRLKLPVSYLWSPALQPKPEDWGPHTKVVGFCFLDTPDGKGDNFEPPAELTEFLAAPHTPPVYIGFGSLILGNPKRVTRLIYDAARRSGQRVLLSSGWAQLGEGVEQRPDHVLVIGNVPHSWLFPRCSAVIHHGGAGTTAAGLRAALPTFIVPVFGDQPFWGAACHRAGVGPPPVTIQSLKLRHLLHAFEVLQDPDTKQRARAISEQMALESGVEGAVEHFEESLHVHRRIVGPAQTALRRPLGLPDCRTSAQGKSSSGVHIPLSLPTLRSAPKAKSPAASESSAANSGTAKRLPRKPWWSFMVCQTQPRKGADKREAAYDSA